MNTVDTNLPRPARDAGIYRKRVDSIAITAAIITICNPIHVGGWAALQQCPESCDPCDDLNDHGRRPFRLFRLRVSLVKDIDMSDIDAMHMSDIDGTAMNDIWPWCIVHKS